MIKKPSSRPQPAEKTNRTRRRPISRKQSDFLKKKPDEELIAPPAYKRGSMRVVALGGLGEVGRNMNTIEYNGQILLIDCGVLFPSEKQPGVDLILPDFDYIRPRLDKVQALVLTHGHEDHIGAVPYLLRERPDIPLIGSKLTLALVQAKCEEFKLKPKCIEVKDGQEVKAGAFDLSFIAVTHSIPDALAVVVNTPAGKIIDTGDMKIDPLPLDKRLTNLRAFAKEGEEGVDLLMMDSTNAEIPGFVKPEISVAPALDLAFSQAKGKIVVASFSSHVHRVQQVVDIACKYHRHVVFVGRSMVRNMQIAADLGYLKLPKGAVVDIKDIGKYRDNQLVYICTGSQGEPLAALGRIANGEHRDIEVGDNDTVIMASSLIPGNEKEVYGIINKLVNLGARVVNRDNASIHVSGHADEGELLYMYNIVQPRNAMPIHGEARHQLANGLIAIKTGVDPKNVVLARNGDVVDLYKSKASIVGSVPCQYVYVDGSSVGEVSEEELEKRRLLSTDGYISAFVPVDLKKCKVVGEVSVSASPLLQREIDLKKIQVIASDAVGAEMQGGEKNTKKLEQELKRSLSAYLGRNTQRKPIIIPAVSSVGTTK